MVFNNHIDLHFACPFGKHAQAIRGPVHLLFVGTAAACIHPYGMATKNLGPFNPAIMILDREFAFLFIRITQLAFAIAHDQNAFNIKVIALFAEFLDIAIIFFLIFIKLVDIFDRVDAKLLLGHLGEIARIHFLGKERLMKRPLRKGDFEQFFFLAGKCKARTNTCRSKASNKLSTIHVSSCEKRGDNYLVEPFGL